MNSNYPFEPLPEGTRNKRKVHCRTCNKPLAPGEGDYVWGYRCPTCAAKKREDDANYNDTWEATRSLVEILQKDNPEKMIFSFHLDDYLYSPPGIMRQVLSFVQQIKSTWPETRITRAMINDIRNVMMGRTVDLNIEVALAGGAQ